jgi:hypothetical protein
MMMTPERICQNDWGISMSAVLALRIRVKSITDIPNEAVMMRAFLILRSPESEPPTITGSNEMVQGASTVSTPASNESKKSIIWVKYS